MNTVTLYKVECTKAYQMSEQGSGYSLSPWSSLSPWGNNTAYYEGHDDGGRLYALPEGYTLAESQGGTDELFDEGGRPCVIVTHSSGLPELVSLTRSVVLFRVEERGEEAD